MILNQAHIHSKGKSIVSSNFCSVLNYDFVIKIFLSDETGQQNYVQINFHPIQISTDLNEVLTKL